jgi:hypothetical protein
MGKLRLERQMSQEPCAKAQIGTGGFLPKPQEKRGRNSEPGRKKVVIPNQAERPVRNLLFAEGDSAGGSF